MPGRRKYAREHAKPGVAYLEGLRARLGWSVARMAAALEIPASTYQKWLYADQLPRHLNAILLRASTLEPSRRANCWDALGCGRGPTARIAPDERQCPAAFDLTANGVNGGCNGGRVCWAISGTLCGETVRGRSASNLVSCLACEFFSRVYREEGLVHFKLLKPGQIYRQP
jgi:hypothetical protein